MEAPSAQELSLEEGKPTGNNRKFFPSKIVDLIREVLIKIIEVVGPPAKKLIAFLKQILFFWLQEFRRATPKQKIWKFAVYYHLAFCWTIIGLVIACALNEKPIKERIFS